MAEPLTPLSILQSRYNPEKNFVQVFPHQEEILTEYFDKHKDDKNLAVELPTGSGKSFVLLAIAQYWLQRNKKVCVLAPNNQLLSQLMKEAKRLNLNFVEIFPKSATTNEANKNLRSYNFKEAFGITNYHRFFTHNITADYLIFDDVHLFEEILDNELSFNFMKESEEFDLIQDFLLKNEIIKEEELEKIFSSEEIKLLNFVDEELVIKFIDEELSKLKIDSNKNIFWKYNKYKEYLSNYFFFISREGFLLAPLVKPLSIMNQFSNIPHKLFFSATIPSKNQFILSLGLNEKINIIRYLSLKNSDYKKLTSGKRLILPDPTLKDSDKEEFTEQDFYQRIKTKLEITISNFPKVLVLCRSLSEMDVYAEYIKEKFGDTLNVYTSRGGDFYESFKSDKKAVLILANRYSGMDFPGKTCEVAVLTSVPWRCTPIEKFIETELNDIHYSEEKIALRLVQSFGRCNRSTSDLGLYIVLDGRFYLDFNQQKSYSKYYPSNIMNEIYLGAEFYERNRGTKFSERIKIGNKFLLQPEIFEPRSQNLQKSPYDDESDFNLYLVQSWEYILNNNYNDSQEILLHLINKTPIGEEYKNLFNYLLARCEYYRNSSKVNDTVIDYLNLASKNHKTKFFKSIYDLLSSIREEISQSSPEVKYFNDKIPEVLKDSGKLASKIFEIQEGIESDEHDTICESISELLNLFKINAKNRSKEKGPYPDLEVKDIIDNRCYIIEVKSKPNAENISSKDIAQLKKHFGSYDKDFPKVSYILLSKKLPVMEDAKDQMKGIIFQKLEDYQEFVNRLLVNVRKKDKFIEAIIKFYREKFTELE